MLIKSILKEGRIVGQFFLDLQRRIRMLLEGWILIGVNSTRIRNPLANRLVDGIPEPDRDVVDRAGDQVLYLHRHTCGLE